MGALNVFAIEPSRAALSLQKRADSSPALARNFSTQVLANGLKRIGARDSIFTDAHGAASLPVAGNPNPAPQSAPLTQFCKKTLLP